MFVYGGGLEYTADEWNIPHSTIGVNSKGVHRRHPYCYILCGYCGRTQATPNPSYTMANVVSTGPSPYTVWDVNRVNASMVSRGGPSVLSPAGNIICLTTKLQAHLPLHPLSNPKQCESHIGRDAPFAVAHQVREWSRPVATISSARCLVGYWHPCHARTYFPHADQKRLYYCV